MMTLITQSRDPAAHTHALELLAEPCAGCGHHGPANSLIDNGDDVLTMCEACLHANGVELVDLQPRLLAVLCRSEWADAAIFRLSLAKAWNAGTVPLSRKRVFDEARWARA